MWTISNEQMERISLSMRTEFEKRVYFLFMKEKWNKDICSDEEIRLNIKRQTDYLVTYNITNEELAMNFIKLSFLNSVMRDDSFSLTLSEIFEHTESEGDRIDNLIIYLKSNDYVCEF